MFVSAPDRSEELAIPPSLEDAAGRAAVLPSDAQLTRLARQVVDRERRHQPAGRRRPHRGLAHRLRTRHAGGDVSAAPRFPLAVGLDRCSLPVTTSDVRRLRRRPPADRDRAAAAAVRRLVGHARSPSPRPACRCSSARSGAPRSPGSCCALLAAARIVAVWPLSDNHIYLLAYWCLAIGLALGRRRPRRRWPRAAAGCSARRSRWPCCGRRCCRPTTSTAASSG